VEGAAAIFNKRARVKIIIFMDSKNKLEILIKIIIEAMA